MTVHAPLSDGLGLHAAAPRPPGVRRIPRGALVGLILAALGCDENRTVPLNGEYVAAEPEPLACFPNLDQRIDSAEIVTAYGSTVRYLVTPYGVERSVNVAGVVDAQGTLVWDWSTDYADDQVVSVVPAAVTDQWYAASFPPGTIVTPFDAAGRMVSILAQNDQSLSLLGLASALEAPPEGKTLLVYQPPVALLQFPVAPGQSFVSTGTIANGTYRGLPYAGQDIYEVEVDAIGEMRLPQLTFTQAHRVRTRVTVEPSVGTSSAHRQVSYFFECFGEVARAVSRTDEPAEDFTMAAEIWRLGLE